jgi:hypothetical protein
MQGEKTKLIRRRGGGLDLGPILGSSNNIGSAPLAKDPYHLPERRVNPEIFGLSLFRGFDLDQANFCRQIFRLNSLSQIFKASLP